MKKAVVPSWPPEIKSQIEREISRLHILQDHPLTPEKRMLFARELEATGLPPRALILGMDYISKGHYTQIKCSAIVEASRQFINNEAGLVDCPECGREGAVSLRNKVTGYTFAFACKCSNGDAMSKAQNLPRWNGEKEMEINNKTFIYER